MAGFKASVPDRFAFITDPERWAFLLRDYSHGAQSAAAVENVTNIIVSELNGALMDVDVRQCPRIALSRYAKSEQTDKTVRPAANKRARALIVAVANRRTSIPIVLGEKAVMVGDDPIYLANREGPLLLVRVLVREISNFWKNDNGR